MAARNAGSKKRLPDYMPILNERMARGDYLPHYEEREITEPVDLCDERGVLNPDAVGWSRSPLVRANLSGRWPRKKKWNFWNWISPDFVFSVTLCDLDYASFCSVSFIDFETAKDVSAISIKRPHGVYMPEHVERSVGFEGGGMVYSNVSRGDTMKVDFSGQTKGGERIVADFEVRRPPRHESLSVVVPWTPNRFQLNSKDNTLPCEGNVTVGGDRYTMDPEKCHAVQQHGSQVDHGHRDERERDLLERPALQDHGGSLLELRAERLDATVAHQIGPLRHGRPDASPRRRPSIEDEPLRLRQRGGLLLRALEGSHPV
jgi:hypothetical protein